MSNESVRTIWPRVARTNGALYSTEPVISKRRRRCDGHLVDPHWIEIGDGYIYSALPPDHPEIGNTGWWHSALCLRCAPAEVVAAEHRLDGPGAEAAVTPEPIPHRSVQTRPGCAGS